MSIPEILPVSPSYYPKGYYADEIKKHPCTPSSTCTPEEHRQLGMNWIFIRPILFERQNINNDGYAVKVTNSIINQNQWEKKLDFGQFCSSDVYLYYKETIENGNTNLFVAKARDENLCYQLKLADNLYYGFHYHAHRNAYDWYKAVADKGEPRAKYMVYKIDRQSKPDLDPEEIILFDLLDQMFFKFKTEPPRLTA